MTSTFDPEQHVECGCPTCIAASEAVFDMVHDLMTEGHCTHSLIDGAVRGLADSAAIMTKPGSQDTVRDYLVALFAARFDRSIIRNAQIDRRNAGSAS